jgi:hypothetical protein
MINWSLNRTRYDNMGQKLRFAAGLSIGGGLQLQMNPGPLHFGAVSCVSLPGFRKI